MKLSLVIQTPEVVPVIPVALLSGSFHEKVKKAAALKVDGLELMTVDPARLDSKQLRSELASARIEVAAIATGALPSVTGLTLLHADPSRAERAAKRLQDLIDFARTMAAKVVTIGSFRGQASSDKDSALTTLVTVVREAAVYATHEGIQLAMEPLNRYEADLLMNVEQTLSFIEAVDQPSLGLLLDTYHLNIEEKSWTEPFRLALNEGRLWHVHVGDNNRLPPGRGLIDFPSIVRILHEHNYTGFISAELLALPDPDTAARQTMKYMRSLLTNSPSM